MYDPTVFTAADRRAEQIADDMPDFSEISNAAIALIKAVRKLDDNPLVKSVEPVQLISDYLGELIFDLIKYEEDPRYPREVIDAVSEEFDSERATWVPTIERDIQDAKLIKPTIDLANMVQGILGAKS